MRVLIAGGTGFVGQALVRGLLIDGHSVVLMRRPRSASRPMVQGTVETIRLDPEKSIVTAEIQADAIVNLVGIIREFPLKGQTFHQAHFLVTKNLVDLAKARRVPRFLQMSALGVRSTAATGYLRTKLMAEEYLKQSSLNWTIFRPSVIFGPRDHLVSMFAGMIKSLPIIPVVGDGRYEFQPVHVEDVCAGFRKALVDDRAVGKTFEFGGPEVLTFDQMLDTIGQTIGVRPVRKIHQPVCAMRLLASVFGAFPWFPITNDQITMLLEGNYTDDKSYYEFVGRNAIRFREGIGEYLK